MAWNRITRRKLSRYGIGEQIVKDKFSEQLNIQRANDYKFAWAAAFTAFWEKTGMSKDELQQVAERTVELRNNALCAEELVADLKDKTGFDVNQPSSTYIYDDLGV